MSIDYYRPISSQKWEILRSFLNGQTIHPNILWSKTRFINEKIKFTPSFQDIKNFPFYYHLGKVFKATSVIQFGARNGTEHIYSCYLQSCRSTNTWFIVENEIKDPYLSFIRKNISRFLTENQLTCFITTESIEKLKESQSINNKKFDLALMTMEYWENVNFYEYLKIAWNTVNQDGILLIDFFKNNKEAEKFLSFINRQPQIFETRNIIAIVEK